MIARPPRVVAKEPRRRLRLEFSGNLIKHLGLLMYGGAVPALAELIANAWDADARNVELKLPLGKPISPSDIISIKDDGRGMTWEDVANRYLVIGRNRRSARGSETTKLGRHVMGRKGIGKLAGFGIARVVELRTVRDKWLTHFAMDFADMTSDSAAHARYEPQILADEAVTEKNSTTVILRHLSLKRAIPDDSFRESLARRFAIFEAGFSVKINGKPVSKTEMPTLMRVPEKPGTLADTIVPGFGPVKYWYGFTRHPIAESDARGISIMVRGRMARPPSMFDISGGVWNQQSLEYLTGEVFADGLDDNEDFVSTDRQSINWTEDGPAALRTWGQNLIKRAARDYGDEKARLERHESLPSIDQDEIRSIDDRLAALPPPIRSTADRLMSAYARPDGESRSATEVNRFVRAIVQLSEDAAGGTSHEGSALLHSFVSARRDVIATAVSSRDVSKLYGLLRANPWLIVSPWRIVLEDSATTAAIGSLKKSRLALSTLKVWAVQHETRRYLIAFGQDGAKVRAQLLSLSKDIAATLSPGAALAVVHITPDDPSGRTAGVKSVSVRRLISQAEHSCEVILNILMK